MQMILKCKALSDANSSQMKMILVDPGGETNSQEMEIGNTLKHMFSRK